MSATKVGYKDNSKMLQNTSKDYSMAIPKNKSYQDDKRSSVKDHNSSYNYTKNSYSSKSTDTKSVVQNNINIGTMFGNLQLGPSMTLSGKRWDYARNKEPNLIYNILHTKM